MTSVDDLEAKEFWGELKDPANPRVDPMFTRLALSIYDCLRSSIPSAALLIEPSEAKPYVTPEMMISLLHMLEFDIELSAEEQKDFNQEMLYSWLKTYYSVWFIDYEEVHRVGESQKIPVFTRKELNKFLCLWVWVTPDAIHRKINKILANEQYYFLDPLTDEEWEYPIIPRSFWPAKPMEGGLEMLEDMLKDWAEDRAKLAEEWAKARSEWSPDLQMQQLNLIGTDQKTDTKEEVAKSSAMRLAELTNLDKISQDEAEKARLAALVKAENASQEATKKAVQQMQQMQNNQIRALIQQSENVGMMNLASAMAARARMESNAVHNGQMTQMAAQMPYGYKYTYDYSQR